MATRAQQFEVFAAGVLTGGATISSPYVGFFAAGTNDAKNAWEDKDKSVPVTKKALDSDGRAGLFGDGQYKLKIYAGDPDSGGVLQFTIDNYIVRSVIGKTQTITGDTVGSVDDQTVIMDTTSGNVEYTLPAASAMAGLTILVNKSAAGNTASVVPGSGDTVNGTNTFDISDQYHGGIFFSDGSNWFGGVLVN